MLDYTERWKLKTAERKARAIGRIGSSGFEAISNNDLAPTLASQIVDIEEQIEEKRGVINLVMPLQKNVLVAVRQYSVYDDGEGEYFNSFGHPEEELPLMAVMMPLDNVLPDVITMEPESIVGKEVRVYLKKDIAFRAELVATPETTFLHKSGITPLELQLAAKYGKPIDNFLRWSGYSEEDIQDYMNKLVSEYDKGSIFRFENEAYWDKDTSRPKNMDVFLEDPLRYILGRNYETMKNKLCHVPIIMFSAK